MKATPIRFNKRQYNQLKKESERIGSSIAAIIRQAVDHYFKEVL